MRALAVVLTVVAVGLAGCLGSGGPAGPSGGQLPDQDDAPDFEVFELPETLSGYDPVSTIETEFGGNGIWIDEDEAVLFASTGGGGLVIVDISDPDDPVELAHVDTEEMNYARDVDLLRLPAEDGAERRIAVLAGSGEGIALVDTTDPDDPELLSKTKLPTGAHNVAVVPGTPYIYNSGGGGAIYGLDASDPEDPVIFSFPIPDQVGGTVVTSDGCHDIVVRSDLGMAYCAGGGTRYGEGGGETFLWDIRHDVTDPVWVGIIDHPLIWYHHQALPSADGDLLLINDEFIAPNCFGVDQDVPVLMEATLPLASVWIYDISDPTSPELLSRMQLPDNAQDGVKVNCGSHFGDIIEDRDAASWGWYEGGALLIDFSDPTDPAILDIAPAVGSTWDARYFNGHVYTGSGDVQVLKVI